ncbi:PAS domain-containing protein [Boeremia exigua]|uniref:PAS domain-containing protein n=1 Tax=Boeremia exigua TaxID=749465 RepID=UPI001E8CC9A0|nr:PAS domain-containing protein [Boeremia exigua]KAH6615201.1 PAS domain-containing protein [Boeremia exigua]
MDEDVSEALKDGYMVRSLPRIDSASEPDDFDDTPSLDEAEDTGYNLMKINRQSTDLEHAFDLSPPPPAKTDKRAEIVAERLFSVEHLDVILKDNAQLQRFTTFLMRYRAHCVPTLVRYLDSKKALKAIQYANALADQITQQPSWPTKAAAASLDPKFEELSQRALDELVAEALPAYITFNVVDVVTELLNQEIIGRITPVMRELVHGLAEVYCLSDPTQEGNPIVFASDEFYNTTQYGSGYAIGKSCRFLHGPNTDKRAIERLDKAVEEQEEVNETVVQYRQDGTPFLALVMFAPLKDNKGVLRYFIGARIDVTQLVEGGKTIDSFHQLLTGDRPETPIADPLENRPTLKALREFRDMLNDEEKGSIRESDSLRTDSRPSSPWPPQSPTQRRFVGIEERISQEGLRSRFAGQVPGVYRNYMLVRPYPSLRIIFTSPSLRIPGLCQSKLQDHIGGPEHVRDSFIQALAQGIGVTAKISWLTRVTRPGTHLDVPFVDDNASILTSDLEAIEGKARWIHCTPLTGSDAKVGVIMIIMVDKEDAAHNLSNMGSLSAPSPARPRDSAAPHARAKSYNSFRGFEYTPERYQHRSSPTSTATSTTPSVRGDNVRKASLRSMGGSRLYADYMRDIQGAQKRGDSFGSRSREHEERSNGLGSMATAVAVKSVNGRGRTRKVGGTL